MKSLMLKSLFIRDKHIKQIMANCPQLESLNLYRFLVLIAGIGIHSKVIHNALKLFLHMLNI
ncbi:hypothetical protein H5410_060723 [Solanum commersonii]|uniref:Uncharacterized protein n=1 Tax=Solanum commersonii TaxID=4109 RepID=A0A9J5W5U6_SOLCO|nr:hypothetical protein H5410_060723 [Solanum commersonii]